MGISARMQDALDRIRQTQSIAQSVRQAMELQGNQIKDLSDQVLKLQAKIDAGKDISPEDLAALAEITSDIDQVNADLRTAIPANTPPETAPSQPPSTVEPAPAPAPEQPPAPAEPTAEEIAQHEQDAAAAAQAKPISGTGAQ